MKETSLKPLEIDIDKLKRFLVEECPNITLSDSETAHCQKKLREVCNVPQYMRDTCPDDCPRLYNVSTKCDGEACKIITKTLKKLTK